MTWKREASIHVYGNARVNKQGKAPTPNEFVANTIHAETAVIGIGEMRSYRLDGIETIVLFSSFLDKQAY